MVTPIFLCVPTQGCPVSTVDEILLVERLTCEQPLAWEQPLSRTPRLLFTTAYQRVRDR